MNITDDVINRLLRRSVRTDAGCLICTFSGAGNSKKAYIGIDGKKYIASRVAWTIANGPIPIGLNVLHKCDVPSCIEPKHLFLGTQKDNMQDCAAKGRVAVPYGNAHPLAKINSADVPAIRADQRSYSVIGKDYGVSKNTIQKIKARIIWRHIP